MFKRTRRLRYNPIIRNMIKDVYIDKDDFIYPLFIVEGENRKEEIKSMPNQFRFSIDKLLIEVEELINLGLNKILLFGIPDKKDECGTEAYNENGIIQRAIRELKSKFSDKIMIVADLCMCEYTSHGHCGILNGNTVDNDKTLKFLSKIALTYAEAGVDIIAPSDMMDGRIYEIRKALDENDFKEIPIMSYSVKYSSSFYGPFRDAADSAPEFGDRKSYQMDFKRKNEAYEKALSDIEEGADIIMVKPALAYLDIVAKLRDLINKPIAVYNVSAEYSMVKSAVEKGWINEKEIVFEKIYAMKRAGADIIITYFAKDIIKWLKEE